MFKVNDTDMKKPGLPYIFKVNNSTLAVMESWRKSVSPAVSRKCSSARQISTTQCFVIRLRYNCKILDFTFQ